MKRSVCWIAGICALACLAGCETMAAIGVGKVRVSDVAYLASAGSPGVPTVGADDLTGLEGGYYPAAPENEFMNNMQDADAWLQENLW